MNRTTRVIGAIALVILCIRPVAAQTAATQHHVTFSKTAFGASISRSELVIPDVSAHIVAQSFRIDIGRSSDSTFAIAQERIYAQADVAPGNTKYRGYSNYLMQNGDTVYFRWEGAPVPRRPNASADTPTETGTMQIIRGTGRYKNIRGNGAYRGYENCAVLEENVWDIVF